MIDTSQFLGYIRAIVSKIKNWKYLLALHSVEGIGSVRLNKLIEQFGDPKIAWEASSGELKALGLDDRALAKLAEKRKSLDLERYAEEIDEVGIKILTIWDSEYPSLLKEIYDPPAVLYYKGDPQFLNKKSIGVVGTRKITQYGREVTENLTKSLVETGLVIVSGLARGVDSVAHWTAVKNEGKTVAVLAGGLNQIYPPENHQLAGEIISGKGVIISEFPPDYPHLAGNFPSRNRIISGLSLGVLVTEAAEDSGSIITARSALEQGREVFAVPGPINSLQSEGTANLIKNGAKLVTNYQDILVDLGLEFSHGHKNIKSVQIEPIEASVIDYLNLGTQHLDDISRDLKKPVAEISALLIKMEIKGLVKNLGGGLYSPNV